MLNFGVYIPNFKDFGDPAAVVELAQVAEKAGWDGVFLWDHLHWDHKPWPVVDPWVAMAAMAQATAKIKFGAMVTPVARRRPQKLAREAVTLDRLSQGRFVFGAGLGWNIDGEFAAFGDETNKRVLGEMLDEGLAVIDGLWSGEPFSFAGEHYRVDDMTFLPTSIHRPRIPVWVAGLWPNEKPFRRAARWDGVFAAHRDGRRLTADDVQEIKDFLVRNRTDGQAGDIIVMGESDPTQNYETRFGAFERSGLTWWLEDFRPERKLTLDETLAVVAAGPAAR